MTKKIISVLLMLGLVSALGACGGGTTTPTESPAESPAASPSP